MGRLGQSTASAANLPSRRWLPAASSLAALGPVLCLYRARDGRELAGWTLAVWAAVRCTIDSDGLHEAVLFYDERGECCWQLCLLPESNQESWQRLTSLLPLEPPSWEAAIGQRLRARLCRRLRTGPWEASLLRFHVPSRWSRRAEDGSATLGATLTTVTSCCAAAVQAMTYREGLDCPRWMGMDASMAGKQPAFLNRRAPAEIPQ